MEGRNPEFGHTPEHGPRSPEYGPKGHPELEPEVPQTLFCASAPSVPGKRDQFVYVVILQLDPDNRTSGLAELKKFARSESPEQLTGSWTEVGGGAISVSGNATQIVSQILEGLVIDQIRDDYRAVARLTAYLLQWRSAIA